MAGTAQTSIRFKKVGVRSTPPHLIVTIAFVTLKGFSIMRKMRPKKLRGTHSHFFLDRCGSLLRISHPRVELTVYPDKTGPCGAAERDCG